MSSQYWLVSLPLEGGNADRTWSILQDKTCHDNDLSVNYRFNVPELRVGTLDSLLALSDDLVKVSALVEATATKIQRQVIDLAAIEGATEELTVDGISAERFLTAFTWKATRRSRSLSFHGHPKS